jgi:hypothetical protein
MNVPKWTAALIAAAWLLTIHSVRAQEGPQSQSSQQAPSPWRFDVDGALAHQSQTDLKDEPGAFEVDRWFVSAGASYGWSPRNSLGLTIGTGQSIYRFDDEASLGGPDPWGKIEDFRAALTARFRISERGSAFVIPTIRFNRETGGDWSDSRSWGLFAAAAWRLSPDLTIGPGFGLFEKLSGGTQAFPILVIDWNITDRWNLATGRGLAASQGPGLTLSYRLTDAWQLGIAGRYERLEFRLDDDGPAPGGIGRDRSFPLVLSARLDAGPTLDLTLFAGVEFGGRLTLKDALDETVAESDYDPAPIFGATARFSF